MGLKVLFINLFIISISVLVFFLPLKLIRDWSKEHYDLFIVIPSGPHHSLQRKGLRETWLKLLTDKSSNYKFVVGSKMCNIHPFNRKSEHSCESLNISLPKDITESIYLHVYFLNSNKHILHNVGFAFTVHHSIIIQSLGINKSALISGSGQIVRVSLHSMNQNLFKTTKHESKISSVTFHADFSFEDGNSEGYVYKKLANAVYFPKGFEGLITVENVNGFSQERNCSELTILNDLNVNTVTNVVTTSLFEADTDTLCIFPSFGFTIKDLTELANQINQTEERNSEWRKYIKEVYQNLQSEATHYKDILIVDMMDVYRNLPLKMLLFFKWLFRNVDVQYVLKTDDDTFVDLLKVREELDKSADWDWWSCFRIGWPVQRAGKWRETLDYKEDVYPPFPTGAGYVLGSRALHWLENRLDSLSPKYQGEDVAMGVWLRDMAPARHAGEVCYWACAAPPACHPRSCNVMQLNVTAVYDTWHRYQDCGHQLCDCAEKCMQDDQKGWFVIGKITRAFFSI